jgi:hypothetical protein
LHCAYCIVTAISIYPTVIPCNIFYSHPLPFPYCCIYTPSSIYTYIPSSIPALLLLLFLFLFAVGRPP